MQQLLPFTVLKPINEFKNVAFLDVATALTVYGIETPEASCLLQDACPRTVATALTVYGIETARLRARVVNVVLLQQLLPFTVLKLASEPRRNSSLSLQQLLPFTVLKLFHVRLRSN